jgi:hypothetical protein
VLLAPETMQMESKLVILADGWLVVYFRSRNNWEFKITSGYISKICGLLSHQPKLRQLVVRLETN